MPWLWIRTLYNQEDKMNKKEIIKTLKVMGFIAIKFISLFLVIISVYVKKDYLLLKNLLFMIGFVGLDLTPSIFKIIFNSLHKLIMDSRT